MVMAPGEGVEDRVAEGTRGRRIPLDLSGGKRSCHVIETRRFRRAASKHPAGSSARAMPAVRPPPPQQVMTVARVMPASCACLAISRPVVP